MLSPGPKASRMAWYSACRPIVTACIRPRASASATRDRSADAGPPLRRISDRSGVSPRSSQTINPFASSPAYRLGHGKAASVSFARNCWPAHSRNNARAGMESGRVGSYLPFLTHLMTTERTASGAPASAARTLRLRALGADSGRAGQTRTDGPQSCRSKCSAFSAAWSTTDELVWDIVLCPLGPPRGLFTQIPRIIQSTRRGLSPHAVWAAALSNAHGEAKERLNRPPDASGRPSFLGR